MPATSVAARYEPRAITYATHGGRAPLTVTHSDVAAQWHPTRNGDLTPDQVTHGSGRKVWWVCTDGHEWKAQVASRARGAGCPVCAGRATEPLAVTQPDLSAQWHPTKNGGLTPGHVTHGSGRKVWWACGEGHEWQARIVDRTRGQGCPTCAGRATAPITVTHPDVAAQWHPTKNGDLTPDQVTHGSGRKVWWVCPDGHEWEAAVFNRARESGCRARAARATKPLAATHPDLAAQWHPVKNGDSTPDQVTHGSKRKVWWVCNEGHEWEARVADRGCGTGCPVCARTPTEPLSTSHPEVAAQWHPTKNGGLTPDQVTHGSGRKVWWVCPDGHEWEARIANRVNGSRCPTCVLDARRRRTS